MCKHVSYAEVIICDCDSVCAEHTILHPYPTGSPHLKAGNIHIFSWDKDCTLPNAGIFKVTPALQLSKKYDIDLGVSTEKLTLTEVKIHQLKDNGILHGGLLKYTHKLTS